MAWITAGAIVGGALINSMASKDSANTMSDASTNAANLNYQAGQNIRKDLAPWVQQGNIALSDLMNLGGAGKPVNMEALMSNPAYKWNLDQGINAINKASAARGTFYNPATLKDIGTYAQGLASNEFGNIWNRGYSLASLGENAAAQTGISGINAANQAGNNLVGAGQAQAAGQVGVANALSGALGQGYNAYLMNQLLAKNQQPTIPDNNFYSPGNYGFGGVGGSPY